MRQTRKGLRRLSDLVLIYGLVLLSQLFEED